MARPKRITLCAICEQPFQMRRQDSTFCSKRCLGVSRVLPLDQLLWPHVEKTDGCWLFRGIVTKDGYGRIVTQAQHQRRMLRAHRVAWALASGVEPTDDEKVCHTCDTPLCVRNDETGVYAVRGITYPRFGHLFLGTPAANSQDRDIKGRNPSTFKAGQPHRYAIGERSRSSKLTAVLVREIRARRAAGESYLSLARAFGLNTSSVWDVAHRKTWTHVD